MTSTPLLQLYRQALPTYIKVMGGILVAVVAVSFLMPYTYTASTTIMPPDTKQSGGGLSALLQNSPMSIGLEGSASNKSTMVFKEILASRTLFEGVIDTLSLMKHPLFADIERDDLVEQLRESCTIETRKSGALSIDVDVSTSWLGGLSDQREQAADVAARIANAARAVLDRLNQEKSVSQARQTRAYIERVLLSTKSRIDSLQTTLQAFQSQNKVFSLDDQMKALVDNAVSIGAQLAEAEVELALARQDYAKSSPQVEFLERKIASLREQYDRVQAGGLVTTDGFSIPFREVPTLMRQFGNLVRDLEIQEKMNAYLESQRMEELIQEAKDVPTVVALDTAIPPRKRSSPKRLLMLALAWIIGTFTFAVGVPLRVVFGPRSAVD